MNFLVLQHLDIETPALIGAELEKNGHRLTTIHLDRGEMPPLANDCFDGIIIMGGPQSANDDSADIQAELAWLKTAIETGTPMLGICRGAQLMARASGATIGAAAVRELGWFPVFHSDNTVVDPVFGDMPDGLSVFQWHGETFSLTEAMTLLATHPDVPAQAFRLGTGQYGLQFHIEIDTAMIDKWIAFGVDERDTLGRAGIMRLHRDGEQYLEAMRGFCKTMVRAWLQVIAS